MVRNLRATANSVTRVINPNFPATLFASIGFGVSNFKQSALYNPFKVFAQVQPLSSGDLRLLDALNIQGADKTIFVNGPMLAISRIKKRGGDLIVFADGALPEGNTWLVKASLEIWGGSTWSKCAVALQDDLPGSSILSTDLTNPNNVITVAATTGV